MTADRPLGSSSTSVGSSSTSAGSSPAEVEEEVPTAAAELHIVLIPIEMESAGFSEDSAAKPDWRHPIFSIIRAITGKSSL